MWGRITRIIIIAVALLCALGTLASFAGSVWWPLDLFSHFRVQLAFATTISTLALFMLSRWRLACITLAVAFINIADIGRLYVPSKLQPERHGAASAPALKLLHFNAWARSNRDPAAFARYLATSDCDLAFVQENSRALVECIGTADTGFEIVWPRDPHQHDKHLLLRSTRSKFPVEVLRVERCKWGRAIDVRIRWNDQVIAIMSPHMTIPGSWENHGERNVEFAAVADWARLHTEPCIVIGDLNATPWCNHFRSLLANSQLEDSQQGYGVQGTWPRRPPHLLSWLCTIPIDHCLHDANWVTIERRVGPDLGSDHLPLEVTLQLVE